MFETMTDDQFKWAVWYFEKSEPRLSELCQGLLDGQRITLGDLEFLAPYPRQWVIGQVRDGLKRVCGV